MSRDIIGSLDGGVGGGDVPMLLPSHRVGVSPTLVYCGEATVMVFKVARAAITPSYGDLER